jgi:hypothetical protein
VRPARLLVLSLLWGALMLFSSSAAFALEPVPAQVTIILGSTEGAGVSPELQKIEALKKAPFDAFPKKALLKRVDVVIEVGSFKEIELPNGRKLKLSVLEKTKDGGYRVSVSINRPNQQDYLPVVTVVAAPGDPFFVAGQKYDGGTMIIGLSVGKAS